MKSLIIFYSYSGKTRNIAADLAKTSGADLVELRDAKRLNTLAAYSLGSFAAVKGKAAKLTPFSIDWDAYTDITIAVPIWAGCPAPPFQNIVAQLPAGKKVSLVMSSGGGNTEKSREKSTTAIANRGCEVVEYRDIKTM